MVFAELNLDNAIGCYLAHSQKTLHGRIPKGSKLDEKLIQQLLSSGITHATVAKLDSDDIHEDVAATKLASAVCAIGVRATSARAGRVNLYSTVNGVCHFNPDVIIRANSIDESITIATVAANQWLLKGKMLATIKIIPYAVKADKLAEVVSILSETPIKVIAPSPHKSALIQTQLPTISNAVLDKTRAITEQRLVQRLASLEYEDRCLHDIHALSDLIKQATSNSLHWLFIVGASAVSDREDVIPKAIVKAGGTIERYGLPIDPGNLLLLARLGSMVIIGLPGCARSAKQNGFDLVLDRLACSLPITSAWITSLSVGGLLTEIADRPKPRVSIAQNPTVNGLLLAAGMSRRTGASNKLLHPYKTLPLAHYAADALIKSKVDRIVAITGHEHEKLLALLKETRIECHYNSSYASGMASSLSAGVSCLINSDAIIVCLADMPHVSSQVINHLIDAFYTNTQHSLFIPTFEGRPGNPVLITKVFFDTLLSREGDSGARYLAKQYPDKVCYVDVSSPGIHQDYDTPEALLSLQPD